MLTQQFFKHLQNYDQALIALTKEFVNIPNESQHETSEYIDQLTFVISILLIHTNQGHIYLPYQCTDIIRIAEETCPTMPSMDANTLRQQDLDQLPLLFPLLIGTSQDTPIIIHKNNLYTHKSFHEEKTVEASIAHLLDASSIIKKNTIDFLLEDLAFELSDEQIQTVKQSLKSRFTIITGGPGTGKTLTIKAIVSSFLKAGIHPSKIALTAPTAKAAMRIKQIMATDSQLEPPKTLHRLLGIHSRHQKEPIDHQLIIIDEASMISLSLIHTLLTQLNDTAHLILVGDPNQLMPVNGGSIFQTITNCSSSNNPLNDYMTTLTKNFRIINKETDSTSLHELISAVLQDKEKTLSLIEQHKTDIPSFVGVDYIKATTAATRTTFLEQWWKKQISSLPDFDMLRTKTYRVQNNIFNAEDSNHLKTLLNHYNSSQIVCFNNQGVVGKDEINAALAQYCMDESEKIPIGIPIMINQNDYHLGLFNGDQGICVYLEKDTMPKQPYAIFLDNSDLIFYPLSLLDNHIDTAFALTIHKSQGSEFDTVAVFVPDEDKAIFSKEWLYTALTRSRLSTVIVGDCAVLNSILSRNKSHTEIMFHHDLDDVER